ncbi:MAG TPA: ubiquinol-cytochrome c reductase iron-sulfur subunit, partial [Bacilli bacterium]|nr:ubiquinol-cytochrome c reductase iron-sulfur subunit [Bacilli bacterium]
MSDAKNQGKQGLSRRQFLTYALGGTGAFMAATVAAPLIPFTIDPLTRTSGGSFVDTGMKVDDLSKDFPTLVEFKVHRKDGWIEENVTVSAWVILQEDGTPLAMSPTCTHLGCSVGGTLDPSGNPKPSDDKWWFHCPCHGGQYTKYGINDPTKPPQRPLDAYEVKVDKGTIHLGKKS